MLIDRHIALWATLLIVLVGIDVPTFYMHGRTLHFGLSFGLYIISPGYRFVCSSVRSSSEIGLL